MRDRSLVVVRRRGSHSIAGEPGFKLLSAVKRLRSIAGWPLSVVETPAQ